MPNYSFKCESCDHSFETFLKIAERDNPIKEPCPSCKKKKITKNWSDQSNSIAIDTTLTPTKVCGGAWNEVMDRVKKATPMHKREQVEQSRSFNAGRFVR